MAAEFCLRASFHARRVLLHAVNLRHGADGFTSPPKEGVLRILIMHHMVRFINMICCCVRITFLSISFIEVLCFGLVR
jgi:hypothetical protein